MEYFPISNWNDWYIVDIETEKLDNPEKVWVICAKNIQTGLVLKFLNVHEDSTPFIHWWKTVKGIIGHNWIGFDGPVLNRFFGIGLDKPIVDTLVISRLLNYNRIGGHSLDSWGERVGLEKISFNDFSQLTSQMVTYCERDVEVNYKVFRIFKEYIESSSWSESLWLEHETARLCDTIHNNGFTFDIDTAKALENKYSKQLSLLDKEIQKAFPPKFFPIREVNPRVTKHGTLHKQDFRWWKDDNLSSFSPNCPFTIVVPKAFNPASPKDIVTRLNAIGWKPTDKTKGHIEILKERKPDPKRLKRFKELGWKVSEENLATLPESAPEAAKLLVERITLASRLSDLVEWIALYNEATGRIHGRFLHIGAWTHRMAHRGPNMANIPGVIEVDENSSALDKMKEPINRALRSLWGVPEKGFLIGCDADSIQLRMFAHYCEDDEFTQSLLTGDKKKGTDPHSVNQRALGPICRTRPHAKTFIYSFLMGAGVAKLSEVLECSMAEAEQARDNFLARYPRYAYIRNEYSKEVWDQGFFIGLDNRKVIPPSQHKLMSGLLQNGEAVLMKKANLIWQKRLQNESVPFWQVNFVHDEWQTETVRDRNIAQYIGESQADAIRLAGEQLQLRCPMAGNYQIGRTWYDTH